MFLNQYQQIAQYNKHFQTSNTFTQVPESRKMKKTLFAKITLALCLIVIILNLFLRQPLYQYGIELIIKMQARQNTFLDWFFLFITMIIDPTVIFVICILIVILYPRKDQGFIIFIFLLLNIFLAAVLKAYDSDPRPIWSNEQVRNIGFYCPLQYGNPSGHSWFAAIFGFGILLQYKGKGPFFIFVWLSITAAILMPLSRMYLGAHSLNQVLQGLLLGLGMCLLYYLKLKRLIFKYLKEFNTKLVWKIVILGFHLTYFIAFLIHLDQQLPDQWEKNIQQKCGLFINQTKLNSLMFIANALFVSIATGIGLGYSQLEKASLGQKYLRGVWQINQQKYQLKYGYFLFISLESSFMLSGIIVGGLIYLFFPLTIVGYFSLSLGGLASGFLYTAKTIQVLDKYKIIKTIEQSQVS